MALSDLPLDPALPSVNGATPTVTAENGQLVINWPNPRPAEFMITSELFEQLITNINVSRRMIATAKPLLLQLGKLGESLTGR